MAGEPTQKSRVQPNNPVVARPLSLKLHPDPVLRHTSRPVERFDTWLSDVFDEMLVLMRLHDGVGLAAPQVGITQRFFVAQIHGHAVCLVNPVVIARCGSDRMTEGCLGLPGIQVDVERDRQIEVQGYDDRGRKRRHLVQGLWARVVQHEVDHLDGVLICDKAYRGRTTMT